MFSPCRYGSRFTPSSFFASAGGMSPAESSLVAASLVDANLKGYDSHGVMRVPYYVQAIKDGEVAPEEQSDLDELEEQLKKDIREGT